VSRAAPRMLSAALADLNAMIAPAGTLARVQEIWPRTAGAAVAAAAQPTAERNGVLTVTCNAAVWAQELDLMGAQLIARINDALGVEAIAELRCRTG
jgi:predicted nucleic acid-binding Zn ribbon protein